MQVIQLSHFAVKSIAAGVAIVLSFVNKTTYLWRFLCHLAQLNTHQVQEKMAAVHLLNKAPVYSDTEGDTSSAAALVTSQTPYTNTYAAHESSHKHRDQRCVGVTCHSAP